MLYLSVTTMTSLGLSDIVPVRPHARAFVMLEQIAGMLYLALAVARVMALTVARDTGARGPPQPVCAAAQAAAVDAPYERGSPPSADQRHGGRAHERVDRGQAGAETRPSSATEASDALRGSTRTV